MFQSLMRVIRGLSLGIWLGAGIMTFITAHYVFGLAPDRNVAGYIMGAILHTGGLMKVGLAVLAIAAHFSLPWRSKKLCTVTTLLAVTLALFAAFYLEPKLVDLRAQFTENKDAPARLEFAKWHGVSMGSALIEGILVTIALICALI